MTIITFPLTYHDITQSTIRVSKTDFTFSAVPSPNVQQKKCLKPIKRTIYYQIEEEMKIKEWERN
jgi:hypothetical protein